MPSETSSVMVLPISVAPASSSVWTAQQCGLGSAGGRPVVVAAAGRHARHVEQVLDGEGEARQRPAGAALDPHPRPRHEGADLVGHGQ
jgi:hypothetical protein